MDNSATPAPPTGRRAALIFIFITLLIDILSVGISLGESEGKQEGDADRRRLLISHLDS